VSSDSRRQDIATIVQVLPAQSGVEISEEFKFLRVSRGEDDFSSSETSSVKARLSRSARAKIAKLNLPMNS